MIESRTLFEDGPLKITAEMHEDDLDPRGAVDFETIKEEDDYVGRFHADEWSFVGMVVKVTLDDVEIAEDSLWGIEHGAVAENVEADAWKNEPAQYPEPNMVTMGSPLNSVINEALSNARGWLTKRETPIPAALDRAEKWADPNKRPV